LEGASVTQLPYHTASRQARTIDFESDVPPLDLSALVVEAPRPKPKRFAPPAKKNQATIIRRALRATVRAGFAPTGFRVGDSGEITVFTKIAEGSAPSSSEDVNEWDEVNGAD
jgi:hypothetical protein